MKMLRSCEEPDGWGQQQAESFLLIVSCSAQKPREREDVCMYGGSERSFDW